jgi:hypothetical protein
MTMLRMGRFIGLLAVCILVAAPLQAGLAIFQSMVAAPLPGSNDFDGSDGYSDDIILNQLQFQGALFTNPAGQFRSVQHATVVSGREYANAEYGDHDDGADGNPHPYVSAGIVNEGETPSDTLRQSTNPAIQDPAIAAAFNGFSLSQGVDGENQNYTIDLIFDDGISDDNSGASDTVPELIFFERGLNSDIEVQLIIGGTIDSPILSPLSQSVYEPGTGGGVYEFAATGYSIDTIEIGGGQELGVAGLDLSDFFTGPVQPAYGVRFTSIGGGADVYGMFLSALNPSTQFEPVPPGLTPVPEPGTYALVAVGLIALGLIRRRRAA